MSTIIKNKQEAASVGLSKHNEALYGLALHKKVVVIEVDDMSAVANNDVVYTFPSDVILERVTVKNYGTTAFSIATSAAIDDGSTDQTPSLTTLAAAASAYSYVEPAKKSAGSQLLWDFGGANSSASTAKARIVIEFLAIDPCNI